MNHRFLLTAFLSTAAVAASAQTAPAPAEGQQPLSRAIYMQRMDNSFVDVDANKDGFMDRAEIEAAEIKVMSARKAIALRQREEAFRRMDTNKDGSLSLQEYNAALVATPIPKPDATPALNRLDTNKDGKVSLVEYRAPPMTEFDRADTNKDGVLSVEEQKARVSR